ncbi:MAG: YceI family protein [Parvularculaceae bacterium]
MAPRHYLSFAMFAFALGACGGEAAEKTSAAPTKVDQASATPATIATDRTNSDIKVDTGASISAIPAGTYQLDPGHGYVTFTYSHLGYSEPVLRFNNIAATIELNTQNPASSTVTATIAANSIDSAVAKFDGHLNSPDLFDTAKFPDITFNSTSLTQITDNRGTLTGDLTIKDVTLPVTFSVTLLKASDHPMAKIPAFGIKAVTKVDRTKWGLSYAAPHVGEEVTITIDAEFHGAKPE